MYKKKFGDQTWVKTSQIQAQNLFFCHFLKFGSLVFFEIAYNDSLQQCLTTNRVNPQKNWGHKFGPYGPKSDPKLVFCDFFKVWFISFLENWIG